jgi:hypothetical protein
MIQRLPEGLHYLQPPMLAFNRKSGFEIGNPGTSTPVAGRGSAFGDISLTTMPPFAGRNN